MSVDLALARWLKEGVSHAAANDAAIAAMWGAEAIETDIVSPLALEADALVEAARQLGFLKDPAAIELADVPGLHSSLIGQPVTIRCGQLGYNAGLTVFVLGAQEHEQAKRTTLVVLRRLV